MSQGRTIPPIQALVEGSVDPRVLEEPTWSGSFGEYLNAVSAWPAVARTAAQRLSDRLAERMAAGAMPPDLEPILDAIRPLADGLRPPAIPIVLAGSINRGRRLAVWMAGELAEASRTREAALFTHVWRPEEGDPFPCPVREDPLHLVPAACRDELVGEIQRERVGRYPVSIRGDLCPACGERLTEALRVMNGDWAAATASIRIERVVLAPTPGGEREAANRGIWAPEPGTAPLNLEAWQPEASEPWDMVPLLVVETGEEIEPDLAEAVRAAGAWIQLK